jgi:hypothetical protein
MSCPQFKFQLRISNYCCSELLSFFHLKVYFGHGGVNGLQEAIHFRKLMVGMPIWADGEENVSKLVNKGAAIKVPKNSNADQVLYINLMYMLFCEMYFLPTVVEKQLKLRRF